jgi:tRNA threonylcarbamoyladenosine biosynthesis protein TsaB
MSNSPRILAIETTARRGGVALAEGSNLLVAESFAADRDHASELVPRVDQLCRQVGWQGSAIEQVHVSVGPGSFTGTRIGVTFAKTLALASNAQVVAVPTFEALALNVLSMAEPPASLVVLMDARQGQVFAERFVLRADRSGYENVKAGELVYVTDLAANMPQPVAFLGEGVKVHQESLSAVGTLLSDELSVPRAESVWRIGWRMAQQGRFSPADALVPVYYRLPTPVERLQAKESGQSG